MKKKWILGFAVATLQLQAASPVFPPGQTPEEMAKMIVFLTSNGSTFGQPGQVGLTYLGETQEEANKILPVSFYSSPNYWFQYVGQGAHEFLDVVDVYDTNNYTLTPQSCSADIAFPVFKCPGDLQVERTNAFVGTDIYDAAVWQIALALAGKGGFTGPSGTSLFDILENQTTLLKEGRFDSQITDIGSLRGTTKQNTGVFKYNGQSIFTEENAYFFRLVPPSFINADPLYYLTPAGTVNSYVTTQPSPPCAGCNPPLQIPPAPDNYFQGGTTWEDFKPITGENAWAFLMGPLQAALIQQASTGATYVPFASDAVQNAVNVMVAFQYMQSPIGAIYYIVSGSLGNVGAVDVYTVSVENNFSALGGLFNLQRILNDELSYESDLTDDDKATITTNLNAINAMINGGTIKREIGSTQTKGLLSFLKHQAWNPTKGMFDQGGLANKPGQPEWVPPASTDPQAVDVQTWGIACLGQPTIDEWFGPGTAYDIWQKTKVFGGYYGPDGELWGVGFSNYDGNGPCSANSKTGVLSGEWTAGAINMARVLITQYSKVAGAEQWVINLRKDEESMLKNILNLRTDIYPTTTAFYLTPPDYNQLLYNDPEGPPSDRLAFLYADRRYQIPFGWIANPIPSLASTGWMAFLYFNFNPFNALGTYDVHPTPIGEPTIRPPLPIYQPSRIRAVQQQQINKVKKLRGTIQ